MVKIFNRPNEKQLRKLLRNHMTEAEEFLWEHLRRRRMNGYKFRRQVSIGSYIVDFYCPQVKLAVEVDGEIHESQDIGEYDVDRQMYIEEIGITVVRFTNDRILTDIDCVLKEIARFIEK